MSNPHYHGLSLVVSGGQTGVDRAALDAALDLGIAVGGWCPKGRLAEDGRIPRRYPLREMAKPGYPPRTRQNVLDSDATLILSDSPPSGGTRLTMVFALKLTKPFLVARPQDADPAALAAWLRDRRVAVLNVAGPKESKSPGIHAASRKLLRGVFSLIAKAESVGEPPAAYAGEEAAPAFPLKLRRRASIRLAWQRKKTKRRPLRARPTRSSRS